MATITEDYVSFETAKLLKEKGFDDEYANAFYDKNAILYSIDLLSDFSEHPNNDTDIAAPTLYMAMKWLREVHDLNINNELLIHGYFCSISHIVRDSSGYIIDVEDSEAWETAYYETYEEACEEAIKYCLENLI